MKKSRLQNHKNIQAAACALQASLQARLRASLAWASVFHDTSFRRRRGSLYTLTFCSMRQQQHAPFYIRIELSRMAQVAAKLPLRTSNMNHRFVGARAWMARILVMYCLAELSWLIACALQARSVAKSCIRGNLTAGNVRKRCISLARSRSSWLIVQPLATHICRATHGAVRCQASDTLRTKATTCYNSPCSKGSKLSDAAMMLCHALVANGVAVFLAAIIFGFIEVR